LQTLFPYTTLFRSDSVLTEVDPSQLGLNEKQCAAMKKLVDTTKREELEKEVRPSRQYARPGRVVSCRVVWVESQFERAKTKKLKKRYV
jgi:hypothetical protein